MLNWQHTKCSYCFREMSQMSSNPFFFQERISWMIFSRTQVRKNLPQGQLEGRKNNKAWWHLGTTTLFTSSVIISALFSCFGNLHNTILTRSLQLSITTGMVLLFSCFIFFLPICLSLCLSFSHCVFCLSGQAKKIDFTLFLPSLFKKYDFGK